MRPARGRREPTPDKDQVQALRDQLHEARRQQLAAPGPVTVLTSDPEDLTALSGGRITVVKV